MDKEKFVQTLELVVEQSSINGTLKCLNAPIGRQPPQSAVELSNWYNNLGEAELAHVRKLIEDVARLSTFGFLVVLDGATRFFDNPDAYLELYAVYGDGRRVLINSREGDELHDLVRRD